jgi:hypothetical protein
MRFRLLAIISIALVCIVSTVGSARYQVLAQTARAGAASIAKAQMAIGKAAAERNMALTDDAKRELAVEAVRQEAASRKTTEGEDISNAKVDQLLNSVQDAQPRDHVDADYVKRVIVNDKTSTIRSTVDKEIDSQATAANVRIPDDVRLMLAGDIEKQTAGLAASGLPVDVIQEKNIAFLKNTVQRLQGAPVTASTYLQAQRAIFQHFVSLRIESVPPGAHVRMNNIELGVTDIPSQPLEPGKMYQFEFALAGYKTVPRSYFVAAGDDSALLREPLEPDAAKAGDKFRKSPETEPTSFPWLYVVVGVAALCILLFLARGR